MCTVLWNVHCFMKCAQFYEMCTVLINVYSFMKCAQFYEMCSVLWNVHSFMKCAQFYESHKQLILERGRSVSSDESGSVGSHFSGNLFTQARSQVSFIQTCSQVFIYPCPYSSQVFIYPCPYSSQVFIYPCPYSSQVYIHLFMSV